MRLLLKLNFPFLPTYMLCLLLFSNLNFCEKSYAKSSEVSSVEDMNIILISIEGKRLWKKKLGPKNSSLSKCDLGLGPGIVKGAIRSLPRFFHDASTVQDIKSRLIFCMVKHQGFQESNIKSNPILKKIITSIIVWLNETSKNENFSVPLVTPSEKKIYEIGKNIFFFNFQSGNFSLASCLSDREHNRKALPVDHFVHENSKLVFSMFPKYQKENNKVVFIEDQISKCLFEHGVVNKSFHDFSFIPLLVFLGVNAGGIRQDVE